MGLWIEMKDASLAIRQRLYVVKQEDDGEIEDFLKRVITMDGFEKADANTLQQIDTKSFLSAANTKKQSWQIWAGSYKKCVDP